MKIGLIDLDTSCYEDILARTFLPLGLLSIAGVAEDLGHKVQLLRLCQHRKISGESQTLEEVVQDFLELITKNDFDILGISSRCDYLPLVIDATIQLKSKQRDIPIILGGAGRLSSLALRAQALLRVSQ